MTSPSAQQEVQGSGSQRDVSFFRSPFPPPKGRCNPWPSIFFVGALWKCNLKGCICQHLWKKMSEGSNYFQLNWRGNEKLLFQKPAILLGWGGEGGRWKIECSKTSLSPLVFMWCGKCKYHILLPTKDIQRWTLYRYFWWNWSCDRHCWYSDNLRNSTIMKNVQFIPYSYLKIFLQLLQNTHMKKN